MSITPFKLSTENNPFAPFFLEVQNFIRTTLREAFEEQMRATFGRSAATIQTLEDLAESIPPSITKPKRQYTRRAPIAKSRRKARGATERIKYTPEQRAEAVRLYQTGLAIEEVCERVGFRHQSTLYSAIKAAGIPKRSDTQAQA